jgi:hypothetical protein
MDELAFGGSADSRIAGLPGDAIEIEAEQSSVQSQACRGDSRFTSGMAATNDDHVEGFSGGTGEAHVFIIRMFRVSRSRPVEWPSLMCPSAEFSTFH